MRPKKAKNRKAGPRLATLVVMRLYIAAGAPNSVKAVANLLEDLIDLGLRSVHGGAFGQAAAAHRLDLLAQLVELRLAGHFIEAGAELIGHAPHLGRELAKLAQHHRQILGTDHDQGDRGDDQEFEPADLGKHSGIA